MIDLVNMIPLVSIVDGKALLETALASLAAGVGVTIAASTAIYGFASFADARRDEETLAAVGAAVLAIAATLVFVGAIAVGLIVMISG